MPKVKRTALMDGNKRTEVYPYRSKDLVWAKMKGFTAWPAMIVEPPNELLNIPHRSASKCVFFFGTRNFAWIDAHKMAPFEGPWKEQWSKKIQTYSFRKALEDIENYIKDPAKIDIEFCTSNMNRDIEAQFDEPRNGLYSDNQENDREHDNTYDDEIPLNLSGDISFMGLSFGAVSAHDVVNIETNDSVYKPAVKRNKSLNLADSRRKRSKSLNALDSLMFTISSSSPLYHGFHASLSGIMGNVDNSRQFINISSLLLERTMVSRHEIQSIDTAERTITSSKLIFGFLGLGKMGSTIVKRMISMGHKLILWNRTMAKCESFVEDGAIVKDTPMDVIYAADITFCCVSGSETSKIILFNKSGTLSVTNLYGKAYVEMSTIDVKTSQDIGKFLMENNGRYLEVQMHGTRQAAENGQLTLFASGDQTVFNECFSCFQTISHNTFFWEGIGNACKAKFIVETIAGVSTAGLAEALTLADRFSMCLKDIIKIINTTPMKSQFLLDMGNEMVNGICEPKQSLQRTQNDLSMILRAAEQLDQSMPITAASNETFKQTKRLGYSDHDSSAVFIRSRFT